LTTQLVAKSTEWTSGLARASVRLTSFERRLPVTGLALDVRRGPVFPCDKRRNQLPRCPSPWPRPSTAHAGVEMNRRFDMLECPVRNPSISQESPRIKTLDKVYRIYKGYDQVTNRRGFELFEW
jgi:hypothetical protein